MTHRMFAGAVAAVLAAPAPAAMAATLPQEGDFQATYYLIDEPTKVAPLADGKTVVSGEATAINTGDSGGGFYQNMTGRCFYEGIADGANGHNHGHCVRVDADGDKILAAFESTRTGTHAAGTTKFVGGTGKYAGLTGYGEYTVDPVRILDKDMRRISEGHMHGHYQLGGAAQ